MIYAILSFPIGDITISTDSEYITGLHIEGDRYFQKIPADWMMDKHHSLL